MLSLIVYLVCSVFSHHSSKVLQHRNLNLIKICAEVSAYMQPHEVRSVGVLAGSLEPVVQGWTIIFRHRAP